MNAPTRMVWYRHWLEMRWTFVPLSILYLFVIPTNSSNALRWDVWFAFPSHPFGPELLSTPLGLAIGERIEAWADLAGRIPWFGFATSWVLAGSGVQNLIHPGPGVGIAGSTMHTLTLPVSRTRLALTRYASAMAFVLVLGLILSAIGLAVFYLRGESVPLAPVGQSLALGFVYSTTIVALGSALTAAMPRAYVWRSVFHVAVFVLMLVPIHYLVAAPARGTMPWGLIAGFGLAALACLAITVRQLARKEY